MINGVITEYLLLHIPGNNLFNITNIEIFDPKQTDQFAFFCNVALVGAKYNMAEGKNVANYKRQNKLM